MDFVKNLFKKRLSPEEQIMLNNNKELLKNKVQDYLEAVKQAGNPELSSMYGDIDAQLPRLSAQILPLVSKIGADDATLTGVKDGLVGINMAVRSYMKRVKSGEDASRLSAAKASNDILIGQLQARLDSLTKAGGRRKTRKQRRKRRNTRKHY